MISSYIIKAEYRSINRHTMLSHIIRIIVTVRFVIYGLDLARDYVTLLSSPCLSRTLDTGHVLCSAGQTNVTGPFGPYMT